MDNYLGLIINIVSKYAKRGIQLDDLVQEGYFGVMEAHNRYDPTQNVKFETYASIWIRKKALEFVRNEIREFHIAQLHIPFLAPDESHPDRDVPLYLAMMELPDADRYLLYLRFGFGDLEPRTYATLGKEFGKSGEWARLKINKIVDGLNRKVAEEY